MKQLVKHLFFCGTLSFMACQNEKSFNGSTDTPTVTPESNQTTANPNGENPDDSIQSDTGNQSTGSTNPPTPIGPEATEEEIQACVQNDQVWFDPSGQRWIFGVECTRHFQNRKYLGHSQTGS